MFKRNRTDIMRKKFKIILMMILIILFFPLKNTIGGYGIIINQGELTIRSPFNGVVKNVNFNFGSKVKVGDELLTLLVTGTSDFNVKENLEKNTILLNDFKRDFEKLEAKNVKDSKDLDSLELGGKIRFLEDQNHILNRILVAGAGNQISYNIQSPINGNVHLIFSECGVGNFVKDWDPLFVLRDDLSTKKLLCLFKSKQMDEISEGTIIESVPWVNWEKGIVRLTAKISEERMNRNELDSCIEYENVLKKVLYSTDGTRKDYGGVIADNVKSDQLLDLPVGMILNINVDQGFTTPLFISLKYFGELMNYVQDNF
jgi:hypothetical protein